MKITIQGLDYSASLDAVRPLTIERKLNKPTACSFWLSLPAQGSVANPVRNESVTVTGDDGTIYFTGYVASTPLPEYAGLAMDGPRYRLAVRAISDEILMDQLPASSMRVASGMTAGQLMTSLVTHTCSATLAAPVVSLDAPVSSFAAEPGARWSTTAGQIAGQARAAYKAVGGVVELSEIPTTLHVLNEADGSLNLADLSFSSNTTRQLANDVTVCGEREPAAYVTEYFVGDGKTSEFNLGAQPYFSSVSRSALIDELFNQPDLDLTVWKRTGGAASFSLGGAGLAMNGGAGVDGQTMLAWGDSIELGGTLLMETSGVRLSTGSDGILAGLYAGSDTTAGCVAGFRVVAQPGTGAVSVQPVVQGLAAGAVFAISPDNQYTLRARLHCPECERTLAVYRSFGDAGPITCGGQSSQAPAQLQFEIEECVNGVAGMAVTLYDGAIAAVPPSCSVVAASLVNLVGSMRAFRLTNLGTAWVVSTTPSGSAYTRRLGTSLHPAECTLDRLGKLVFVNGYIPLVGEQIAVSYRSAGRSVGRAVNADNQQALAAAGLPSVSRWIGTVTSPPARSSADCRNAAAAIVEISASANALWSGRYRANSAGLASDVWPGEALFLKAPAIGLDSQVVVRAVTLSYASTYPDLVAYDIAFANDWAEDLAIKTSESVPDDAWLPAAVSPAVLSNLNGVMVTELTASSISINSGMAPPPGGGFEIRRRDFAFMPGEDADLVMRASQQNMTFSRETASDRFYIRMYDGSTPPNYSEFSAAIFINSPVG